MGPRCLRGCAAIGTGYMVGPYSSPPCPTGSPQGEVFVNPSRGVFHCPVETAPGPGTTISFELPRSPRGAVLGTPEIINGIAVYPYPAGPRLSYLVPSLGVEMTVNGPPRTKSSPHAHEITAICCAHRRFGTKCPVVMAFGDVRGPRFAVPSAWPVYRTAIVNVPGNPCRVLGIALTATQASLSTDTRPFIRDSMCARIPPYPYEPLNGVQVDSGLRSALLISLSFSTHCLDLHGLTACPATSPAYSILAFKVTVPGGSKPVYLSIGLAGNDMVARAILYSIRAGVRAGDHGHHAILLGS